MSSLNRAGWVLLAVAAASSALAFGCSHADADAEARSRGLLGGEDGGGGEGDAGEGSDGSAPAGDDGGGGGGGFDAGWSDACDLSKPFNAPVVVPGFDSRDVYSARISTNETTAYLSVASGGAGGVDLYTAARTTTADPFVIGAAISELNTNEDEYWPSPSADGKMLFFESAIPLTTGGPRVPRIWTSTRASTSDPFGAPFVLGAFLVESSESAPYLHPNGHSVYFASTARGGKGDFDLFVADVTNFGVVTAVRNIESANSVGEEMMPVASYDERAVFYTRINAAVNPLRDIWVVGRSNTTEPFGVAQKVVEVSSLYDEYPSAVSPDGCRLYLISNRPVSGDSRYRVWVASKP